MEDYSDKWLEFLNKNKVSWEVAKKFKFFDNNSKKLCIIFTGQGKFVLFDFFKIFGPLSNDKLDSLFFCDLNDGFYLSGIQGYSKSIEETCENISKLANEKKYESIYFIGTSMGGFASIMHSIFLKDLDTVKKINTIVFNPYSSIGKIEYLAMFKKIKPEVLFFCQQRGIPKQDAIHLILNYKDKYLNLQNIIENHSFNKNITYNYNIIHGNVIKESERCNLLKGLPNSNFQVFNIQSHNIAGQLKKDKKLLPILESFINL